MKKNSSSRITHNPHHIRSYRFIVFKCGFFNKAGRFQKPLEEWFISLVVVLCSRVKKENSISQKSNRSWLFMRLERQFLVVVTRRCVQQFSSYSSLSSLDDMAAVGEVFRELMAFFHKNHAHTIKISPLCQSTLLSCCWCELLFDIWPILCVRCVKDDYHLIYFLSLNLMPRFSYDNHIHKA